MYRFFFSPAILLLDCSGAVATIIAMAFLFNLECASVNVFGVNVGGGGGEYDG